MMGRSHIIVGACSLEHAYVASVWIDRINVAPLIAVWHAFQSYLGLTDLSTAGAFVLPLYLIAYFFGTLLPDIDNPNSLLGRFVYLPIEHRTWLHAIYVYLVIGALRWLHPLVEVIIGGLEKVFPAIMTYHPEASLKLTALDWICPVFAWIFFGAVVHLFWDSLSACGNCWFYKLFSDYIEYSGGVKVKKGHKIKLYRAGEWSEYLLVFLIVIVTVASFVWTIRL